MDLIDAVRKQNKKKVREFLESGADVMMVDDGDKITPLHFAATRSSVEIVFLLLAFGADINAETIEYQKPIDRACEMEKWDVVSFLLQWKKTSKTIQ